MPGRQIDGGINASGPSLPEVGEGAGFEAARGSRHNRANSTMASSPRARSRSSRLMRTGWYSPPAIPSQVISSAPRHCLASRVPSFMRVRGRCWYRTGQSIQRPQRGSRFPPLISLQPTRSSAAPTRCVAQCWPTSATHRSRGMRILPFGVHSL
jgi:hypothetical protein